MLLLGEAAETTVYGTREERIFTIAGAQRGRIARRQLLAAGVSASAIDRLVARGFMRREQRGVFVVGHDAPIVLGAQAAVLLSFRPGAALTHHSATALWEIWRPPDEEPIHVVLPGGSLHARPGVRVHRSDLLEPGDLQVRHGLPVTSPARTALDMAALLDGRDLERLVGRILIQRLATVGRLNELLRRAGRHPGRASLQEIITGYTASTTTRSEAEERFLALIRRARLPQPLINTRRHGHEIDFFWADQRVAVEIDGFAYHSTRDRFESDRRRDRELRTAGVTVIRITWRQLQQESEAVIADVAAALARTAR